MNNIQDRIEPRFSEKKRKERLCTLRLKRHRRHLENTRRVPLSISPQQTLIRRLITVATLVWPQNLLGYDQRSVFHFLVRFASPSHRLCFLDSFTHHYTPTTYDWLMLVEVQLYCSRLQRWKPSILSRPGERSPGGGETVNAAFIRDPFVRLVRLVVVGRCRA